MLTDGFVYILLFKNLSIALAMWALMLFYFATKELLADHDPIFKFICVKIVVFLSFWQGTILKSLEILGYLENNGSSGEWQSFLTTNEMVIATYCFYQAFPVSPYVLNYNDDTEDEVFHRKMKKRNSFVQTLTFKEFVSDSKDNFMHKMRQLSRVSLLSPPENVQDRNSNV